MNYHLCEAIMPYYDEFGQNCTYILLKDGTKEYFKIPTKTYIRKMFYALHIDPTSLNHWTCDILHKQQGNPLIISQDIIFLPVRAREVIGRTDGCMGYVLGSSLTHIGDYTLKLRCGATLPTRSKANYLLGKQKDAKLLHYTYSEYFRAMR